MTLGDIFDGNELKAKVAAAVKGTAQEGRLRIARRFLWWLVGPAVNSNLDEMMELPINDTLGTAYLRLQTVRDVAVSLYDQPEGAPIELGEHKVRWRRGHRMDVEVNGRVRSTIDFDIELVLTSRNAHLWVEQGYLVRANPGDVDINDSRLDLTWTLRGPKTMTLPKIPIRPKGSWHLDPLPPFDPRIRILPAALVPKLPPEASGPGVPK